MADGRADDHVVLGAHVVRLTAFARINVVHRAAHRDELIPHLRAVASRAPLTLALRDKLVQTQLSPPHTLPADIECDGTQS